MCIRIQLLKLVLRCFTKNGKVYPCKYCAKNFSHEYLYERFLFLFYIQTYFSVYIHVGNLVHSLILSILLYFMCRNKMHNAQFSHSISLKQEFLLGYSLLKDYQQPHDNTRPSQGKDKYRNNIEHETFFSKLCSEFPVWVFFSRVKPKQRSCRIPTIITCLDDGFCMALWMRVEAFC